MRKSELSQEQINRRREIISFLEFNGWSNSDEPNWFEKDVSFTNELMMIFKNESMNIELEYSFKSDELGLFLIDRKDKTEIYITLSPEENWNQILEVLIEFGNQLNSINFRDLIKSLIAISGEVYTESEGTKYKLTL